jgi:uncharacterized protein (UPF0332 family)
LQPLELIKTARLLVSVNGKPRQSDLKRSVSTIYYALFHAVARCCADAFAGTTGADRSERAWSQIYRALDHGHAKNACKNADMMKKFPLEIQELSNFFVEMQAKRHSADYDPDFKVYKTSVLTDIETAEVHIKKFKAVGLKHKRAYAAWLLLKVR